jgi:hypothetical protein
VCQGLFCPQGSEGKVIWPNHTRAGCVCGHVSPAYICIYDLSLYTTLPYHTKTCSLFSLMLFAGDAWVWCGLCVCESIARLLMQCKLRRHASISHRFYITSPPGSSAIAAFVHLQGYCFVCMREGGWVGGWWVDCCSGFSGRWRTIGLALQGGESVHSPCELTVHVVLSYRFLTQRASAAAVACSFFGGN